jgi:MFS family permease
MQLEGTDLGGQDLCGLDFTGADLRRADLRGARAGLRSGRVALLAVLSVLGSVLAGIAAGLVAHHLRGLIASDAPLERFVGRVVASEFLLFLVLSVWKSPRTALRWCLLPSAVIAVLLALIGGALGGTGVAGVALLAFSVLLVAIVCVGTLSRAVAGGAGAILFVVVVVSGSLAGTMLGGGLIALALSISEALLSRRARQDAAALPLLSEWSASIARALGTSLRNADLRGAQLDGADLRYADLRGARLDGASVVGTKFGVKGLDDLQWVQLFDLRSSAAVGAARASDDMRSSRR